jgi:hypothetical protein
MTVGGGGAGEGYKGGESGSDGGGGKGRGYGARELVLRGRMTAFLLRITS